MDFCNVWIIFCFSFPNALHVFCKAVWIVLNMKCAMQINSPCRIKCSRKRDRCSKTFSFLLGTKAHEKTCHTSGVDYWHFKWRSLCADSHLTWVSMWIGKSRSAVHLQEGVHTYATTVSQLFSLNFYISGTSPSSKWMRHLRSSCHIQYGDGIDKQFSTQRGTLYCSTLKSYLKKKDLTLHNDKL